MADHIKEEEKHGESFMEKIAEKIHGHGSSSSSSDSEDDKTTSLKAKVYRLFGREKPVHTVLGGGNPADLLLWRDKKVSAGVLGGATAIWVLFDVLEYHLLALVCHGLILGLIGLFLYSNASTFIKKSPPQIPVVCIPVPRRACNEVCIFSEDWNQSSLCSSEGHCFWQGFEKVFL